MAPSPPARPPWFGVGFRTEHEHDVFAAPRAVDWLEVLVDPYLGAGGARRARLVRLRDRWPLALHGVGLAIAGSDPLSHEYLGQLREIADLVEPAFVSDHLAWTSFGGHQTHDLLPVAYTELVLAHVAARVDAVQERLGRRLLLENASVYVAFRGDEMSEAEFLAALVRRTGCGVLLDVNNLYVNACNLGVDPMRALAALPVDAVGYLHLAGHAVLPDVRIDTHDADVPDPVWSLFELAAQRFPTASVIVERDDHIPPFAALAAEAAAARARHAEALARAAEPASAATQGGVAVSASRDPLDWESAQKALFERIVDKPLGFAHADASSLLDDERPVRAARGLRVYSDAWRAGMERALATNFPALARVLTRDDFAALAASYLRAHPPRRHGFVTIGESLAAHVARFAFATDYGLPASALAGLAALEQAQLEAQDAPDPRSSLTLEALAALAPEAWERARFGFAPALRIVVATHDVLPAVQAGARGEDPPRPAPGDVGYLVYRGAVGVRTERIDAGEARVLAALARGTAFADACTAAARDVSRGAETGARALVAACARGQVERIVA